MDNIHRHVCVFQKGKCTAQVSRLRDVGQMKVWKFRTSVVLAGLMWTEEGVTLLCARLDIFHRPQ